MLNFLIGLTIGAGVVWVAIKWKKRPLSSSPLARGEGMINPNAEKMREKQDNLEKVLAMAREKGEIRNDDVEHGLGVSNATAERYLQELESQGQLTQIGRTGQSVLYRPK